MKRSILNFVKGATLALLVLVSQSMAFANGAEPDVIKKAREAVSSSPNNWYILAQSAEACLDKHLNVTEAGEWIEKSLSLEKNSYTLEIMGDFYVESEQPKKAIGYFVKSLELTKKSISADSNRDERRAARASMKVLQAKIAKAV